MKKTNPRNKLTAVALSVTMACTAPAAFTAAAAQTPESDAKPNRIEEIIAGMTLREKAGQMIIADFDTWKQVSVDGGAVNVPVTTLPEEVKAAIARNHFGGIILMRTNCPESEQTLRLVNEMQAANLAGDAANPVPLLIATDQEGGIVTRLGEGTRWPDCMALTATGDPANAESAAKHISEELSALGINTDFAPVLDVNNNPANPVIGQRSFGDDPAIVVQYGLSYLNGLQEGGTIASLKHFPGHGDVDTDSHTGFPRLDKTYEELKECELIPFQAAIDAGADIVMTAHIQYPKIETETYTSITTGEKVCLPATLSRRILTGILREDMGFDGVIVSDALNMQAIIDNFALNDVCVMAIEAGIDMFLMPVPATDPESLAKLEAFEDFICEQVEKGVLTEERLEASVRRILTMKAAHGLLDVPKTKMTDKEITAAAAIPGSQANRALEWDLMKKAVTLLKNENDLLPLKIKEGEKVLCLYSSDSWLNTAEYSRLRLMEEGLLPEGAAFEAMSFGLENREECLETAKNADYVIGVTTLFGASALDPATKSGAEMAVLDDIIEVVHDAGHPFILMSAYLPYDVARFQAADAIVVTYGSLPMPEMPAGNQTCSPNIPAAMCGIFGGYEFAGQLPINIPKLDENYHFTDEILYARAVRSDTQNMTADGSTESITDPASDDSAEPENGTPSDNTTEPVTDPASGDSAEPVTDPASDDSAEPEGASAASEAEAVLTDVAEALADVSSPLPAQWQAQITFPDWKGYTDDTLAMNSMYTFYGCHGQGAIYVQPATDVTGFKMYVNGTPVDTSQMTGGGTYPVDISALAMDGQNTIQISNIRPFDLAQAVTVTIPYPEVLSGTPAEAGISEQALSMLSDMIEADVENGFPSAQLAIIRGGRLVYENAWGRLNSYLPDGSVNEDSPAVTTQTLYDLASVTKMFSVNYALQKLLTDGAVDLDAKITQFLGDAFVQDTILLSSDDSTGFPDLDTIKDWKAGLTIRDLLRHQGGFAADPGYSRPWFYVKDLAEGGSYPSNPLFAGNGADEATKEATIKMICKTPLQYKPGTKTLYSDVDYIILGLVVEKITGMGLDKWLKETFWDPMGLTRITYNPLENGFTPDDCAATELNGNTRDGVLNIEGFRTYTLQGEVHDETAYYSMNGVSGHAGMFASATDLAKLASVMLSGGYGEHRFFSGNVMEQFTAPKKEDAGNWGLGWWRQGDSQRVWYFGTQAKSGTIGHQGWTGTLVMIDPDRQLVIAFLTNRINSPVTDRQESPDQFDGNWFTTSTVGFVPQILSIGMDTEQDISAQLLDLSADMVVESLKFLPAG
ncbi:MAG: penicillin binding protein PBP4B, partial [Blautia sp.]|nr:penicillin binding protein PBP4B [Blautia sp.]